MPSYTNAPACRMLATRCAVCGRSLLDAKSVELGIGPDCAKRYGYNINVSDDNRAEANYLVYQIALSQNNSTETIEACERLKNLGFARLSSTILDRKIPIKVAVSADGNRLEVKAPYSITGYMAFRAVQGRFWDKQRKVTTFPISSKRDVYTALQNGYSGMLGISSKGVFKL